MSYEKAAQKIIQIPQALVTKPQVKIEDAENRSRASSGRLSIKASLQDNYIGSQPVSSISSKGRSRANTDNFLVLP